MAAVGEIIAAADYNTIRQKVANILGVGSAQSGYGQNLNAAVDVDPLDADVLKRRITKAQWDALRFDIINARVHQVDVAPTLTVVSTTDPVKYGASHPNYQYNTVANDVVTDKFIVAPSQAIITSATSATKSTAWVNVQSCTLTVTFTTADQARYFWNSGGKLRFTSSRTGGISSAQNTAWTNLLSAAGTQDFSAVSSGQNAYSLTTSYQTWYTIGSSLPYNLNNYTIQVKADTANSSGTARIFYFNIVWTDGHYDVGSPPPPGDYVDGTLSISVAELRAAGTMLPSGTFAITPPTYSITSISGS